VSMQEFVDTATDGTPAPEGEVPVLEFRGIDTFYGAVHILKNVDLRIQPGEMVCLLGGNASGKTTTLKTILGMVDPAAGEVPSTARSPTAGPRRSASPAACRWSRRTAACSSA
jgi:ABC-type sugar transport system ATPase subunit